MIAAAQIADRQVALKREGSRLRDARVPIGLEV